MTSPVVLSSTPTSWNTAETSISVGVGSPQEGNRLLLGVITSDGVPSVAGWTEIVPDDTSNFFEYSLFHKIAGAAEPDASLTLDTADLGVAFVVEVNTDALPVVSTWDTQGSVTTIIFNNPGTPNEDAIVLRFGYLDRDPRTVDSVAGHTLVGHVSTSQGNTSGSSMSVYEAPVSSGVDAGAASGPLNFSSRTGAVSVLLEEVPSASPPINHPIELQPEAGWNYTDGTSTTPADPQNAIPFPAIGDQIAFEDTAALEGSAPGARDGGSVSIAADGVVTITPAPTTAETFRYYLYDDSLETWGLVGTFTWDLGAVTLDVDDLISGAALEDADLAAVGELDAEDLTSGTTLEDAPISQAHDLAVDDLVSATVLDDAGLGGVALLVAENMQSATVLDNASLESEGELTPQNLFSITSLEDAPITQAHDLAADDLASPTTLENATVAEVVDLFPEDLTSGAELEETTVLESTAINVVDLVSPTALDNAAITQRHQLSVEALESMTELEEARVFLSGTTIGVIDKPGAGDASPGLGVGNLQGVPGVGIG